MGEESAPEGYTLTTDKQRIDFAYVHAFLARESYWANGISEERVRRSIEHSLCFAVLFEDKQVGFARVITDYATFAYLSDVFIDAEHRGRRVGRWLVHSILRHPELGGLRRWLLRTADAHGLYARSGFGPLATPELFMERVDPGTTR